MSTEVVLKQVKDVIRVKAMEMKKKKCCTSDEIRQFTGLVNAFTRLHFKNEESQDSGENDGDPTYYNRMILGADH
jgi:hypothetical protein